MTNFLKKNVPFGWSPQCQQSFEELKRRLTTAPILPLPSENGGFVVYTDASRMGLGGVLMQNGKVIAYTSRQLRPHGSYCICIEDVETLLVWGNLPNLHRPQKSEIYPYSKRVEFETKKMD